jgi:hypothetical protein
MCKGAGEYRGVCIGVGLGDGVWMWVGTRLAIWKSIMRGMWWRTGSRCVGACSNVSG